MEKLFITHRFDEKDVEKDFVNFQKNHDITIVDRKFFVTFDNNNGRFVYTLVIFYVEKP